MSDITTIKRELASRAQAVAEFLLPNGRREGHEWRAGSVAGEPGKSLGVHLDGAKAGIWSDFASGESGDLLDLWCAVRGSSLAEAVDDARGWLGLTLPEPYRKPRREFRRPEKPKCKRLHGLALDYLTEERNLKAEVLERYKIAATPDGEFMVFPFLLPDGTLALAKKRKAEKGADPLPMSSDFEHVLFGWQAIPDNAREVVITEGELDAPSWASYGFPALSVPMGGGRGAKQQWIENEFDRLARFERIYIATDMDKEGEAAAEEIASRLGRHRCYRVQMPHKDGNACLVEGVSQADMEAVIRKASNLDPEGLKRASDFTADVIGLFWPEPGAHVGYSLPYAKLKGKVLFRPAEVTLWTGESGDGKSQILSDCVPHWISEGSRVCIGSLEMKGAQQMKRMVKQTGGVDRPTPEFIHQTIAFLDRGLLIYEKVGKAGVEALLDIFEYARAKYGCDQFIIDSLMRLGIAGDDYNGQEKAMFQIVDWSIRNNVHVHLVAHARKGEKGRGSPSTSDVKGAMEIGANAFNILSVWRNRELEDKIKKAETDEERKAHEEKPGVVLNIAKQRNGDFEGKVGLWFDQETYRYSSSYDRSLMGRQYVPYLQAAE